MTQKFERQEVYSDTEPPTVGAITGPRKLAAKNKARGTERWLWCHRSVIEPPELVTVGEPKNPEKKRKTRRAAMFGARAQASWKTTKWLNVVPILLFLPLDTSLTKTIAEVSMHLPDFR